MKIDTRCKHERGKVHDYRKTVSDHRPLTRQKVSEILDEAIRNRRDASKCQVRLTTGIPGMTCPRPIEGPVAKASTALDVAFVKFVKGEITKSAAVSLICNACRIE